MNLLEYSERNSNFLTLGLDIGSSSIGWAIAAGEQDGSKELIDYGAHIFVDAIKQGEDTPASVRRLARQSRRQYMRKRMRNKKVIELCAKIGIIDASATIHRIDSFIKGLKNQTNIFQIRKEALDDRITNEDLFRIIYSFSNHRGKSNRYDKDDPEAKDLKEKQKVNLAICKANDRIDPNGTKEFRTYGEYAYAIANEANGRCRNSEGDYRFSYTFDMLKSELSLIFKNQLKLGNALASDTNLEDLIAVIFYQRPLKSIEKQVGLCTYYHNKGFRRAPKSSYSFFRYSVLQDMSNISVVNKKTGEVARLSNLIESAEHFYKIEKYIIENTTKTGILVSKLLPALSKDKNWEEKQDHSSEKKNTKISVNENFISLYKTLSVFYPNEEAGFCPSVQDFVAKISSYEMGLDTWHKRVKDERPDIAYKIGADKAIWGTHIDDNAGFGSLCVEAMNEISASMLSGKEENGRWKMLSPYDAKEVCGFIQSKNTIPFSILPPLEMDEKYLKDIFPKIYPDIDIAAFTPFRNDAINPRVKRILAEMRKLVNFLIKKYGKVPDRIVIETARETNTKAEKKRIEKRQKEDRNYNQAVKEESSKKGTLFAKYKLWFQQNGHCAYSNEKISKEDVGSCEIEHAVPQSIFFTSRDKNILLVKTKYNQDKSDQFHIEYLGGATSEKWHDFVTRINNSNMSAIKKAWLTNVNIMEDVKSMSLDRYLDNTKHASVAAMKYLRYYLYPSEDIHGTGSTNSVMSINGETTALLRKSVWKFPYVKDRETHYHHAIDAITIAAVSHKTKNIIQKHFKEIELKKKDKKEAEKSPYNEPIDKIVQRVEEEFASNNRYVSHSTKHSFNQRGHEATAIGIPKTLKGNVTKDTPTQNKKSLEDVFISFFGKRMNNAVVFDLNSSYDEREAKMLSIVKNPNIDDIQKNTILDITPDGMMKIALQEYARIRFQQEILRDQYQKELANIKKTSNDPDEEDRIKALKKEIEGEISKTIIKGVVIQRGKKKTDTVVKSCVVVAEKAIGSHVVIKKGDREFLYNTKGATHFDVYYCDFGKDKGYKIVPQFFGKEKNFFAITQGTNQIDTRSGNFKYKFSLYGGEILKIQKKDEIFLCIYKRLHIGTANIYAEELNTKKEISAGSQNLKNISIVKQQIDGTIKKVL